MASAWRSNRICSISRRSLTAGLMKVRFLQRLRDEQKFSGPEALREQVLKDIERAKEVFARP